MVILSFATILLLTVVAGLLVWLHIRLKALQKGGKNLPMLSEKLAHELLQTRQSMTTLSSQAKLSLPKLESKLGDAYKTLQEIDFVLDKAEKTLKKFDLVFSQKNMSPTPQKQTLNIPSTVQSAVVKEPVKQTVVKKPVAKTSPASPPVKQPVKEAVPSRQESILRQHMARQMERHQS